MRLPGILALLVALLCAPSGALAAPVLFQFSHQMQHGTFEPNPFAGTIFSGRILFDDLGLLFDASGNPTPIDPNANCTPTPHGMSCGATSPILNASFTLGPRTFSFGQTTGGIYVLTAGFEGPVIGIQAQFLPSPLLSLGVTGDHVFYTWSFAGPAPDPSWPSNVFIGNGPCFEACSLELQSVPEPSTLLLAGGALLLFLKKKKGSQGHRRVRLRC